MVLQLQSKGTLHTVPVDHDHDAADVTTGTFVIARIPVASSGTTSTTAVVRADDSRLSNARTPTSHTHAESEITGLTADLAAKAPLDSPVFTGSIDYNRAVSTPNTITYATTITLNAALGNAFKITATGILTLNPPTNPIDGQMMMVSILASGANRAVTISSSIQLTTGCVTPFTVNNGKVGYFGLRYSVLSGNWTLLAQTQEL